MHLIFGYGVSGKAALSLLRKKGLPAIVVDKQPSGDVLLDSADFPLDNIHQVIVSPGILPSHPLVQNAVHLGIEVIGEMEFALRWTDNPCIGVTGSNGKTTTTLLITHALNQAGKKAKAVGNVGTALSTYLLDPDPEEILVIELSSFQLETMRTPKFSLGVYLNLVPNHLDRHASMEEYALAKANLQNCLNPGAKFLVSKQVLQDVGHTLRIGSTEVFDADSPIPEDKNRFMAHQNICAAHAACLHMGVSTESFLASLPLFQKPPHRIEWVAESDGIRYYNDSKATSVEAVMHAVSFFSGPIVLIVGGLDKGAPYSPWTVFRQKIKKIVAYGSASAKIQNELKSVMPLESVTTLEEAVMAAHKNAAAGDTVLLSPGCSSYDQFLSYEYRGDAFKKLVRETIGTKGVSS